MIRQEKQEALSPPPVVYAFLDIDLDQPAPKGHYWISLHRKILRYRGGEVVEEPLQSIPLFLDPIKNEFRHMDLSPDGQYYYYAGVSFTYCGRVGDAGFKPIVLKSLYRCKFSPDSRFLCGYGGGEVEGMIVVDCATRRVRRLATPEYPRDTEDPYTAYRFGWYPDSRHIWYQEDVGALDYHRLRAYKQDVVSGRRWVLKGRQMDEVYRDWALLDPRYRWGPVGMDDNSAFRYSPRQQVRVRVKPLFEGNSLRYRPGHQQMSVEWRDGRSRVVIERGQHPWVQILPRDVTEDGRWVLLSVGKQKDEENFHSELLAVEVPTDRRYSYVELSGKGVGLVGTPRLETPYDRPLYQFWRGEANL
ncbi:hypothetical protein DCOP10_11015 [Armatimonadetes bacterium DC]|nr:hypothetical protein DCOP10_11015 [Armatimonadetes bacterium DC]